MPVAVRLIALSALAAAVCCGALMFAASVPIELLEAPAHPAVAVKVIPLPLPVPSCFRLLPIQSPAFPLPALQL
jgi:hypothetical protein